MRCVKLQVLRNKSEGVIWTLTLNYGLRVIVACFPVSTLMHLMFVMLLTKVIINLFNKHYELCYQSVKAC